MRVWSTMKREQSNQDGRRDGNRTYQKHKSCSSALPLVVAAPVCDPEETLI